MFIGKFNRTVIVTYLSIVAFLVGAYFALFEGNIAAAIICLVVSGICDTFDGKIARMVKNRTEEDKQFGIQIDSLADVIAFTVSPLTIFFGYILKYDVDINPVLLITASSALIVCGITRLAYFNVVTAAGPVKYYSGLPVTLTSAIFPILYLLDNCLSHVAFVYTYLVAIFVVSFLFVLNFKIKKQTSALFYILIPIIGLIFTVFFILMM
ncbi:MAG: CDP-alcohol phosphatidyltransferase family protein [Bacilli bacterium]|nr:CDP-alcohol phosphatidyltransferase family protein [Bacilli bacterium]